MSYAEKLHEVASQYRAEMKACDDARKAMMQEFIQRIQALNEEKKHEPS